MRNETQGETSTGQIAMTEPGMNTARSSPRQTRRHRGDGTVKSTTSKQVSDDAIHAIIEAARTFTDPASWGHMRHARKEEPAGGAGREERKRHSVIACSFSY